MSSTFPICNTELVASEFSRLRREKKARHRDIAEELGIAEGELIAAHAGLSLADGALLGAVRLQADWPAIIAALEPLGEVMALTRNASCVHEKTGVYRKASHNNHVGLVLGGDIDLRVFYRHWEHGFAVREMGEKEVQRSLQFFDAAGRRVRSFPAASCKLSAFSSFLWDGRDDAGRAQRAGLHFVRLEAGGEHRTTHLTLPR